MQNLDVYKMRVAYVHGGSVPSRSANSVHVMKMCAALANEGAEVTLFCPDAEIEGNPFDIYGVPSNFKIIHVAVKGIYNNISSLKSLLIAWKMAKLVRKQDFDFVFGRYTFALYFLRHYRLFVFESHMLPPSRFRYFIEKKLFSSKLFLGQVVITRQLKSDYSEAYPFVIFNKIIVLQDAADIAKPVTEETIPNEPTKELQIRKRPVIGYLGHLLPGKCMEILSQVARKRPQYDFHVVGGKQEWVDKWKADDRCKDLDNIRFYGYVDNKTIPYYYNQFDICILPFSNNIIVGKFKNANIGRWTSPLKLFEAMSFGKAILTTNLPTVKEVLTDGENCLMESETNIDGWCEKLDQLVNDEDMRLRLGNSAKALFERNYTWNIRAQKIINILSHNK